MPIDGYFDKPFGIDGDLATVPDDTQPDGTVSYQEGFGPDYSLASTDPDKLNVPRDKTNQIYYDITSAIQNWQQNTIAPFITSAMNGGSPYSYPAYVTVLKSGVAYISNTGSNTDTPPSSKWTALQLVTPLLPANNLSDVASAATSRTNLGLGTAATQNVGAFLQPANNLSDVASAATSRTNLGLGTAAVQNTSAFLQPSNNLSDVSNATTARSNLTAAKSGANTDITSLASPALASATATTQASSDDTTKVATTQFVKNVTQILQQVRTEVSASATGTTIIPYDNTIPQNTEGDQYMSLSITPKSSSSILVIEAIALVATSVSGGEQYTIALFQDSTAGALAACSGSVQTASASQTTLLRHEMTSGTTSATTFKIRIGGQTSGTITFNGISGTRLYGGVAASSITITEYVS